MSPQTVGTGLFSLTAIHFLDVDHGKHRALELHGSLEAWAPGFLVRPTPDLKCFGEFFDVSEK